MGFEAKQLMFLSSLKVILFGGSNNPTGYYFSVIL